MYGIFTYIYHQNQPNVGKYSIGPTIKLLNFEGGGGGVPFSDTKNTHLAGNGNKAFHRNLAFWPIFDTAWWFWNPNPTWDFCAPNPYKLRDHLTKPQLVNAGFLVVIQPYLRWISGRLPSLGVSTWHVFPNLQFCCCSIRRLGKKRVFFFNQSLGVDVTV